MPRAGHGDGRRQSMSTRSIPPGGDVIGTHHGLRSRGRFRSLVIRLALEIYCPAFCVYLPEASSIRRNRRLRETGHLNKTT